MNAARRLTIAFAALLATAAWGQQAPQAWAYKATKDALGEKTIYSAQSVTDSAMLTILQVGTGAPGLTIAVKRGALFYCPVQCTVRVKVDEEESIELRATRVPNTRVEALAVLPPLGGLVAAFKRGSKVRVAAPMRDKGAQVYEFETGPLIWSPPVATQPVDKS